MISEGRDSLQWDEERKTLELKEKLFGELKTTLELHQNCEYNQKKILELMQSFEDKT